MKPTALVTGATGFIGRHLVRALRDTGYPVVAWSRSPDGAASSDAGVRLEPWPALDALSAAIARLDRPLVFHLAAAADRSTRDPAALFEANIHLTARVMQACAEAGVRGVVHAGSCTEYGSAPAGIPIRETAPLAAADLYGASKAAAGLWARAIARKAGLGFAWARLFGLYGPGLRPPRILPTVHAALRGKRPVDLTPGSEVRDWLYVGDAAAGLIRLGAHAGTGAQGVFNLCTGRPLAIRELAVLFARRMGADPGLLRFGALPEPPDEAPWLVGDPSAAQGLGWSATTEIGAGLDRTIAALDAQARGGA